MAGTLTLSTLSDGTNSTSATNPILGSAKAWVNFNPSTGVGVVNSSFNVGSVTYNSAGKYTINFTNAFANANYASALSARNGSGSNVNGVVAEIGSTYGTPVRTTTALGIVVMDSVNGAINTDVVSVIILSS